MADVIEPKYMTIRGYGRARAASEGTIRYHIRAGTIVLDGRGQVDVQQADESWARRRHRSAISPGALTAAAKIRRARAKLEMAQDAVTKLDDGYVVRTEAVAQYQAEAAYVVDQLKAMPALEAANVARDLGITPEKAERLLDEFIALCLIDLGDLPGRLADAVDHV